MFLDLWLSPYKNFAAYNGASTSACSYMYMYVGYFGSWYMCILCIFVLSVFYMQKQHMQVSGTYESLHSQLLHIL